MPRPAGREGVDSLQRSPLSLSPPASALSSIRLLLSFFFRGEKEKKKLRTRLPGGDSRTRTGSFSLEANPFIPQTVNHK